MFSTNTNTYHTNKKDNQGAPCGIFGLGRLSSLEYSISPFILANEGWIIFWDKIKDFTKSPTFWTCLIYFTKKVLSFKLGLTFSWAASLSIKEGDWQDMWDLLVYKNHLQIWIQNTNTSKNQSRDGRRDAKKSTLCVVPTTTIQF